MHVLDIYNLCIFDFLQIYYCYIPLLLLNPPNFLNFLLLIIGVEFEYNVSTHLYDISILGGILITITVALHMNNDHIRYYNMDVTW